MERAAPIIVFCYHDYIHDHGNWKAEKDINMAFAALTGHAAQDLHLGCSVDSGAKGLAAARLST